MVLTFDDIYVIMDAVGVMELNKVYFYQRQNGETPVMDYLVSLENSNSKDSRIKKNKIIQYIDLLKIHGTTLGEPIMKHLEDQIWELRPSGDRVLFAALIHDTFVLLHVFRKQTQKTPKREIEQARRELDDYLEREDENGKQD